MGGSVMLTGQVNGSLEEKSHQKTPKKNLSLQFFVSFVVSGA